jgi:hypothetical protein
MQHGLRSRRNPAAVNSDDWRIHDGTGTEFLTNACLRDLYGWWRNEASSFKNFPNFACGFDSIARPKTIEGTITKDAVVHSESLPGGPGSGAR